MHTITDAKGQVTTYTYDTTNRLTEILYHDGKKDTFNYDAVGNLVSYTNDAVTGTITYDELNRKTTEIVSYGTFTKSYSYTYNTTGDKATYTSPEGVTYTYNYNKNNQPTSMAFGTKTIGFDYVWQQQRKTTLPNGVGTDYQYNAASWLSDITVKNGSTTMANSHYLFDSIGNITGKTTNQGSHGFGYDPLYQLTQATHPILPAEAYSYDSVGNRQTSTDANGTISYGHNANNELTSFGTATVAYDSNGNMTQVTNSGQVTAYIYNAKDRLERVELPDGGTVIYKYDPFGRRISKTVNSITTYFMYADEGLIGEYGSTGIVKKAYGWTPDSTWGTNPVLMVESGQYYYYHNDHLGTPQTMTDGTGNVVWSAEYSAFGSAVVDASSTVVNNLRFPGQYFDQETGLHYNWNRYYHPVAGRYTQVDPIGFVAEDENLYRYTFNNSVNLGDSSGEVIPAVLLAAAGGAAIDVTIQIISNLATGQNLTCGVGQAAVKGAISGIIGFGIGKALTIIPKIPKLPFRGPEPGRWKDNGKWVQGWHFHLGDSMGLDKHHLPQQTLNWLKNLIAIIKKK